MFNNWILIGLLSLSTYISRIVGVEVMAERKMSPTLRVYFNYVPVAIISALIIKQIFVPVDGQLIISIPVLVGCVVTAIAIKTMKLFLPSVLLGAIIGLMTRYFMM
ncbi:AzlD domain-containing protein [Bacillus solimangrovi]|uniref:Branched-chain amino acid transport n=1 Tax=Bacillus solimangrovi TaxID=1305675 RepID=A0A1E5LG05_9BACI|nr:AzlD domain-containing protein [Bacillus solimangrovi]OEH93009.1 branched-chain amino acid transport [Bacillus solimangrovi]